MSSNPQKYPGSGLLSSTAGSEGQKMVAPSEKRGRSESPFHRMAEEKHRGARIQSPGNRSNLIDGKQSASNSVPTQSLVHAASPSSAFEIDAVQRLITTNVIVGTKIKTEDTSIAIAFGRTPGSVVAKLVNVNPANPQESVLCQGEEAETVIKAIDSLLYKSIGPAPKLPYWGNMSSSEHGAALRGR